jgi:ribonucleotide monophosphatase NagD (HAD superfamily)
MSHQQGSLISNRPSSTEEQQKNAFRKYFGVELQQDQIIQILYRGYEVS